MGIYRGAVAFGGDFTGRLSQLGGDYLGLAKPKVKVPGPWAQWLQLTGAQYS